METSISIHSVVVAAKDQVSCALGEETAILSLKNSVYYGTNPVGTLVWNLLRHPRRVEQLRDALIEVYEVELERCERDLIDLLERMRSEGLIELQNS